MTDIYRQTIYRLIIQIKESLFIKSILTLSAGVVVSQVIALGTIPIISRIYDPEILGDFSIITSNTSIISVVVCLGLMTAIMIPKENDEAKNLCRLLAMTIVGLSTVLLVVVITISNVWQMFSVNLDYKIACLIIYVLIVLSNISSVCYAYVNRQKMYKVLFWNPTLGTVTNAVVSIGLGLLHCGLWGYALGNILAVAVVIVHMLLRANPFSLEREKRVSSFVTLRKYKVFPLYQLPANLIGAVSQQLPVLLIKKFFGSAILGSYVMCLTILGLPSKLLAAPINNVYFREATERYNNGQNIGEFSFRILVTNIKIAIIPICILATFGEQLFSFVLGERWLQAGSFASILCIYQLVLFCSSCLSGRFVIIGRQKLNLYFSIASICLNLIVFGMGFYVFGDICRVLIFFVIAGTLFELTNIGMFLYLTGFKYSSFLKFVCLYIAIPSTIALLIKIGLEAITS